MAPGARNSSLPPPPTDQEWQSSRLAFVPQVPPFRTNPAAWIFLKNRGHWDAIPEATTLTPDTVKHPRSLFPCLLLLWANSAHGIAPRYIPDPQLARSPIIVVAKWEKAPFEHHAKYRDPDRKHVVEASEGYTKLRILRVIKGPGLKPGEHELLIGLGIAWSKDGKWLGSGTSTELSGDVNDITQPNLWFLTKARSWDETRTDEYLSISNYRSIQPLVLENYFRALKSPQPEVEVPKLLSPERPVEANRVLRYLSGGIWPWPFGPDPHGFSSYTNPDTRGPLLKSEADRVWKIVGSATAQARPPTLSVYAELAGEDGIIRVRTLLDDKDPEVRGIAIGILARHHDLESLDRLEQAAGGVDHGWLACKVIAELSSWGHEGVVPSLITWLQNNDFAYQYGDDLGIPALKARQALKQITGHWFPFNVEQSAKAWSQASLMSDQAQRGALLAKLIPGEEYPLLAELVGEPVHNDPKAAEPPTGKGYPDGEVTVTIRLQNISPLPVTISRVPSTVSIRWPAGVSGGSISPKHVTSETYVTLEPAESLEFTAHLDESFLLAEPDDRSLKISFRDNGNSAGVNAWIGTLEVMPGSEWKELRVVKTVEELWPNGNLKATGKTVNGYKMGEWNYFNEEGDRTKVAHYLTGGGTATCNPKHPANRGAGKRPRAKQTPAD